VSKVSPNLLVATRHGLWAKYVDACPSPAEGGYSPMNERELTRFVSHSSSEAWIASSLGARSRLTATRDVDIIPPGDHDERMADQFVRPG
jgi:hypothetical protein